jgi:hypothetical protein
MLRGVVFLQRLSFAIWDVPYPRTRDFREVDLNDKYKLPRREQRNPC